MIQFHVSGMTCNACVNRITRALRRVGGVTKVQVDLGRETVAVRREPAVVSNAALVAALAEAGYEAGLASAVIVTDSQPPSFIERLLGRHS